MNMHYAGQLHCTAHSRATW